MIKFFRKIRQNMLIDNQPSRQASKISKYLLYGLGEIVLVVIGILIALQINNWNEERKQKDEEIETLKNIREDFTNTIIEFKENNAFRRRIISTTRALYSIIHSNQNEYSKQELDTLMSDLFINPTYNGQSETLNILFNSGKINILGNDSIKKALVIWPQQVEDITEDEIYSSNIIYNDLLPLVKSYVSLYDIYNCISYKKYALFDNASPSIFDSDYTGLFNNREFEGTLSARELPLSVSLLQTEELIESANNILRMIDNELAK